MTMWVCITITGSKVIISLLFGIMFEASVELVQPAILDITYTHDNRLRAGFSTEKWIPVPLD